MKKVSFFILLAILFIASACGDSDRKIAHDHDREHDNLPLAQGPLMLPAWAINANIYEVNLRQYSTEGTMAAFEAQLPRLKEMGVNILWFMPIYPISVVKRKGTKGSYYAIADYKAVNPEFGTLEEFKSLVSKIHEMGMYVVLDWVANHTGWDHTWIMEHPEWYVMNGDTIRHPYGNDGNPTDWYDTADLDYDNEDMRAAMIDALKFWVTEADIDGYRCDVADMVPNDFWAAAREALDAEKPVFMLAEAESDPEHFNICFNANYGWSLHHLLNQLAKGEKNADDLEAHIKGLNERFPDHFFQMNFTSNHDENSWNGTGSERMGDAENAMTVLAFTLPGMPLIYSGQESGESKRLEFFEKDEIAWGDYSKADFYKTLLNAKEQNRALWNGPFGGEMKRINSGTEVIAFERKADGDAILVMVNLTNEEQTTKILAHYHEIKDIFTGEAYDIHDEGSFTLEPYGYKVLSGIEYEGGHHDH